MRVSQEIGQALYAASAAAAGGQTASGPTPDDDDDEIVDAEVVDEDEPGAA